MKGYKILSQPYKSVKSTKETDNAWDTPKQKFKNSYHRPQNSLSRMILTTNPTSFQATWPLELTIPQTHWPLLCSSNILSCFCKISHCAYWLILFFGLQINTTFLEWPWLILSSKMIWGIRVYLMTRSISFKACFGICHFLIYLFNYNLPYGQMPKLLFSFSLQRMESIYLSFGRDWSHE